MGLTKISGEVLQQPINIGVVTATSVSVGSAVTIHSGGFQVGSSDLHSSGLTVSNVNTSGIITASSFSGNLTGNATGLSGTPNVTVGVITASSAIISGNVSIAGTLTYEDVTNIDSVGLITARSGVRITTGGLVVTSGVSTFTTGPILIGSATSTGTASQPLQVTGGVYVSGSVGIGTTNPTVSLDIGSKTDAIALPQGTTAQRPSGNNPYIRYNTTNSALEFYNGTDWVEIISDYFPTGSTTLG